MIESPLLDEIRAEAKAEGKADATVDAIVKFLQIRLGPVPAEIHETLRSIRDPERLNVVLEEAARAETIQEFASGLRSE